MSCMSGKYFVDTNVLVYAFDGSATEKQQIAQQLLDDFGGNGMLVLSTQVLQEFFCDQYPQVGKAPANW